MNQVPGKSPAPNPNAEKMNPNRERRGVDTHTPSKVTLYMMKMVIHNDDKVWNRQHENAKGQKKSRHVGDMNGLTDEPWERVHLG